eukprot:1186940-Pyramimonas_sp.AAC.1
MAVAVERNSASNMPNSIAQSTAFMLQAILGGVPVPPGDDGGPRRGLHESSSGISQTPSLKPAGSGAARSSKRSETSGAPSR